MAVLGPTNTGKTHLAVERMLGHASGMIGLPLRLLAREIYDRIVAVRGPRSVALITGEEKIVPPRAHYFVCTVEAMPVGRDVEFLAVDEIQLAADPERGHIFTQRLLHARGRSETMFLGAATMAPLIRRLLPGVEMITRERFSNLSFAGARKLSRLPRRSAVVAFSADEVYAIAELIRRQRGGAAVVMGSLSPRTRNAQVALYQSGEVDFLVATDAIGMGLNMDLDHVAFAGLTKFDGRRTRPLFGAEIAQIAGRAGRYRRDGTFGLTASCDSLDEELIDAVEQHRFEAVTAAQWRNGDLDMRSLAGLMASLNAAPTRVGLRATEDALDERTLRIMAKDDALIARCRDRSALLRLWEVCQTPDFRKTTLEDHVRLVGDLFDQLASPRGRVGDDWMASLFGQLDRTDGEIEALSGRLAGVRTLAYVANRPDWLNDAEHWRGTTRILEERLSDTLHEKLMARFIDRRTSALVRGLGSREELLAGVSENGEVTVEGHFVGRLRGLGFEQARSSGVLEERALRAAAQRAVAPEVSRRLGLLASEPDEAFALNPDGVILWRGDAAGTLTNDQPFRPSVRLNADLGAVALRERATRRIEAFVAAEAGRRLGTLRRLEEVIANGQIKGLARGLVWRLLEAGGVLDRREAEREVSSLSKVERRGLRQLGVSIGTFCLYLPSQITPDAQAFSQAFAGAATAMRSLGFRGRFAAGTFELGIETLERFADLMRTAPQRSGGAVFTREMATDLGWSATEASDILRALDFVPVERKRPGHDLAWRRRRSRPDVPAPASVSAGSPFAALASLTAVIAKPRPHRPRRRRTAHG